MYLAIGRRTSYTPSVEAYLIERAKRCLSVLVLFRLHHAYAERIPGSLARCISGRAWERGYYKNSLKATEIPVYASSCTHYIVDVKQKNFGLNLNLNFSLFCYSSCPSPPAVLIYPGLFLTLVGFV